MEYAYDGNGMIADVQNVRGGHDRYTYLGTTGDDRYRLASIIDPRDHVQMSIDYAPITFTINGEDDTQERVVTLTDGSGAVTTFHYEFVDNPSSAFHGQNTVVEQPKVNGVNSNIAFVLDSGRTRVETRVDTVGAADYVRKAEIQDRERPKADGRDGSGRAGRGPEKQ